MDRPINWALWARQLNKEFQGLCYEYGISLGSLRVEVRLDQSELGLYHPQLHLVSIASKLIEEHPWSIVVEVLKHELSHAYVYWTNADSFQQQPHGSEFQRACEIFRVAPWARKATLNLEDAYRRVEEHSEVSRKVKKLLALAQSSNEHEASLALQRAMELSHQIDPNSEFSSIYVSLNKKRVDEMEYALTSLLVDFYHVKVVFYPMYNAHHNEVYRGFEISGRKDHIEMAEYVFDFLRSTFLRLWKQQKGGHRSSYMRGLMKGFRESLKTSLSGPGPSTLNWGLVATGSDVALEKYYNYKHPRIAKTRLSSKVHDPQMFSKGQGDGRKVKVHNPLRSGDSVLLLT